MILLIYTFLLFKAFEIIFFKYGLYSKFQAYSNKCRFKFFYKLSQCKFCMDFYLSVLSCLICFGFTYLQFEFIYFLYPIFSASLNNIILGFYERN